jgi:hypothetical protein
MFGLHLTETRERWMAGKNGETEREVVDVSRKKTIYIYIYDAVMSHQSASI